MSWFRVRRSASGFTFEDRIGSLFSALHFNLKYPKMEFACQIQGHIKNSHEIDHTVNFLPGTGMILPKYAKNFMAISCKKTLEPSGILAEKTILSEAMDCHNVHSSVRPDAGLITTSSILENQNPDLGDGIYLWDLRRCFFNAWRAYYSNSPQYQFNSKEHRVDNDSSFIFQTTDPEKPIGIGYCNVFYDGLAVLDSQTLKDILLKTVGKIHSQHFMKTGKILFNIHVFTGYVDIVSRNRSAIQSDASNVNFEVILQNFFDYSVVPWEPICVGF